MSPPTHRLREIARARLRARGLDAAPVALARQVATAARVRERVEAARAALDAGDVDTLVAGWQNEIVGGDEYPPELLTMAESFVATEQLESKLHALCDSILAAPDKFVAASVAERLLHWALVTKGLERAAALDVIALLASDIDKISHASSTR